MCKWWWYWLPGWHKKWKLAKESMKLEKCRVKEQKKLDELHSTLEKRRARAISDITGERLGFELMARRPRRKFDAPNNALLDKSLKRFSEIEENARSASSKKVLDDLIDDAEKEGQFRAYLCPREEILVEGILAIALMKEWGVPKEAIIELRKLVDSPMKSAMDSRETAEAARGALRTIFEEQDSWRDYTTYYEKKMKKSARWLFRLCILLILVAIVALNFQMTIAIGIMFAGLAGGCVSVMNKMPVLEVGFSRELDSHKRRIMSRIGVGMIAGIIGCGMFAWGLIPIIVQGHTFAEMLCLCSNACSISVPAYCNSLRILILLAVPMIFGFSERALMWFEHRILGSSNKSVKE